MAKVAEVGKTDIVKTFVDGGLVWAEDPFGGTEHELVGISESASDEWETLEEDLGEVWDFSLKSKFVGKLSHVKQISLTDGDGEDRTFNLYGFTFPDGSKHSIWGTYQIDEALKGVNSPYINRVVYIEHCGTRDQGRGHTINVFTIKVKKEN
ncbi:MAG: hypothetical protein QXL94_02955 [Candidatus Parvarchaeum sp.]